MILFDLNSSNETLKSYLFLLKWLCIALVAGISGSLVVHSFFYLLTMTTDIVTVTGWYSIGWSVAAAIVVAAVIYRIAPRAAGEGVPSYIRGIREDGGRFPLVDTFFKYWASLFTLGAFGSGGVVGPMGRTASGLVAGIVRRLMLWKVFFREEDIRTASICGMAAAVGTIFHSPIGAGIFAVELIRKNKMGYKDLFPAIMSSCTAVFICKALSWKSFYTFNVPNEFLDIHKTGWLILCAVLSGALGALYEKMYMVSSLLFKRREGNVLAKVVLGMGAAFCLGYLVNPALFGTSRKFIPALISGEFEVFVVGNGWTMPLALSLLVMLLLKLVTNCIVVGSGMSAGFTGPAAIAGMLLGVALAVVTGVETGSATYYAFVCAGFSGMLAGSMNIPIASAIMGIEIFGLEYSFAAGLASVVAFQMSRGTTIYSEAGAVE